MVWPKATPESGQNWQDEEGSKHAGGADASTVEPTPSC